MKPTDEDGEPMLSVEDIAARAGVSPGSVFNWRWRKKLDIPAYRLDKKIYFKRADVERWLAGVRNKPKLISAYRGLACR